jgi:hypothetical protein
MALAATRAIEQVAFTRDDRPGTAPLHLGVTR